MKPPIRYALFALGGLFLAVVGATGLGMLLPRRHVAVTSAVVHQPIGDVWFAVSDMRSQPTWRSDLNAVEFVSSHEGRPVWLQRTDTGDWPLEFTEVVEPVRLVACVADSSQGFGGTWTYQLSSEGDATRVTITERGFIDAPLFRFLARFVFGLHGSQEAYLRDLGRHFGEDVTTTKED